MAKQQKVPLPIYLDPEQYRLLKELSEETDAPMTALVRRAINNLLIERGKKKPPKKGRKS